ncbi:hypothetical protein HYH03_010672 [Edaphochlamys debaryana]|uniref:Protein kinase domain-containing protein n=1 Tax=Edaphochlamys debaryana TaxID=47281 RepID=A0A835Y1U3_9CHLO|nr:hypothetical protein HYH03_010672 [Edaphochlamys debaryana]|eukprot:KAG2491000.1 hypothetical protein HYH03_010672 [Edaphochlamys debaryana]
MILAAAALLGSCLAPPGVKERREGAPIGADGASHSGRNCVKEQKYKALQAGNAVAEEVEVAAMHGLQSGLLGLRGSWSRRAGAAAAAVAESFAADEVRLYAAAAAGSATERAPARPFVLVASSAGSRHPDSSGRSCSPEGQEEDESPVVGQVVCPLATTAARMDTSGSPTTPCSGDSSCRTGTTMDTEAVLPLWTDMESALGLAAPEPLPSLLARMLEAKAPVFRTSAGGEGVSVALVPLSTDNRIVGAVWIARRGRGDRDQMPASTGPHGPTPACRYCPSLLSSPSALRHLGLSLSLCLLSADGHRSMAVLAAALLSLSCAPSLQQLVAGLCEGAAETVRHRFSLSPRVVAALVPDLGSAVGLLLSTGSEWPPAALSRPPSATTAAPPGLQMGPSRLRAQASMAADALSPFCSAGAPAVAETLPCDAGANPSEPVQALRAKPFLLTRTVLGCLARKVDPFAAAGSVAALEEWQLRFATGRESPVARPVPLGVIIEDCAAHVQDARRPSRDILLLLSGAGASMARQRPPGDGASPTVTANSGGGAGGAGACVAGRGVRSLLVLTLPLPAAECRCGPGSLLGLYVLFPQHLLPLELLREARALLLELLQLVGPLLSHRFARHFCPELDTLMSGAPGSYAVVPGQRPGSAPQADTLLADGSSSGRMLPQARPPPHSSSALLNVNCFQTKALLRAALDDDGDSSASSGLPTANAWARLVAVAATAKPEPAGLATGPDPGSVRTQDPSQLDTGSPPPPTVTVLAVNGRTSTSQAPALVASLQSSIALARADAAAAVAAVPCAGASGHSSDRLQGPAPPHPAAAGLSGGVDLASVRFVSRIGEGGCAVVFRGRLGPSVDCAVKLMELPTADEDTVEPYWDADEASPDQDAPPAPCPGLAADGSGDAGGGSLQGAPRPPEPVPLLAQQLGTAWAAALQTAATKRGLAARRVLLRNAMELAALTTLGGHPNIMQVYGAFINVTLGTHEAPHGGSGTGPGPGAGGMQLHLRHLDPEVDYRDNNAPPVCAAVISEWCDKGSLAAALATRAFPGYLPHWQAGGAGGGAGGSGGAVTLNYRVILMTLLDVALALRHLHAHNLIHRDVKSANVFLRSCATDPRGFTAKLGDFGFVVILNQVGQGTPSPLLPGDEQSRGEPYALTDDSCGTVSHMAPEALEADARLGASCDVYSFGILMWELTAGGIQPYAGVERKKVAGLVRRGTRPFFRDSVPPVYRRLAESCWSADPSRRPRAGDLVAALSHMMATMPGNN